jgi:hypothetical protein
MPFASFEFSFETGDFNGATQAMPARFIIPKFFGVAIFTQPVATQGAQMTVSQSLQLLLSPIDKQSTDGENAVKAHPTHAAKLFPPSAAFAHLFMDTFMFASPRHGSGTNTPNCTSAGLKRVAFCSACCQRHRSRTQKRVRRSAGVSPHRGYLTIPRTRV